MRINIAEINRINTCGILHKNNWDYEKDISSNPSYLIGMKEILRWHYKRNKPIDQESFMTFLSNLHNRMNLTHEDKIPLEKAFRDFIDSSYYRNLNRVYMNHMTDIKINADQYLEHYVPVFINNPDRPIFLYYDLGDEPREMFLQRHEIMHNAVWSFYSLNKLPTFTRIWFNGEKIKSETFKLDEKYVLKAKKNLITIGKNTKIFVTPPIQICSNCSKVSECGRFVVKKGKANGSKRNAS